MVGPIELELREYDDGWRYLSDESFSVMCGAAISLGIPLHRMSRRATGRALDRFEAELLSEAIECAEALDL